MGAISSSAKKRVLTGLHRFLIMFAYLLVIFTLFQLHEYVVLRQHDLPYTRFGFGIIKALVLAKVMLIGDEMKLGKRLNSQPLVYSVVGRSGLFTLLFVTFDFLEQIVRAIFEGREIIQSISAPGGSLLGSVIIATIMCVMLIPYFVVDGLRRRIGAKKLKELLFSQETIPVAAGKPTVAAGN